MIQTPEKVIKGLWRLVLVEAKYLNCQLCYQTGHKGRKNAIKNICAYSCVMSYQFLY